ncbi:MAG: GMC family oxidoreductase [Deltaproteobacteria bacterium]|nr:GMC family oxidoreductase [Deltaproteobacteria bacterium]
MTTGAIYTRADWPSVPGATGRRRTLRGTEVELSADVVIVGSGAGGAVMAAELAEAGYEVLVLEEGGHHRTEEFNAQAAAMVRMLYRDGGLGLAVGNPPVFFSEGRCVGGSTTVNGGMSWRTPEAILARWSAEHGLPCISPEAMEPYFARVETYISAVRQAHETLSRDNVLLKEGADQKGWRLIENIRNQLHCAGSNNCAFGCPTAAKRSTLVSYLPRALAFGARVYADCRVEKVLFRGQTAIGVQGRVVAPNGELDTRFTVRAREVIVAGGAVQTPVLLLRSGVRVPSGKLGHNLTLHPNAKQEAIFDDPVDGWKGAHQVFQVREFQHEGMIMAAVNLPPSLLAMTLPYYGRELGEAMAAYNHMVTAGVLVEDTTSGRVVAGPGGRAIVFYALNDHDAQTVVRGSALLAELFFAAGARRVLLPFHGVPALTSADEARRLPMQNIPKGAMELASVHVMGTAAMGADERRHVCTPWGQVRGYQRLHVADASLFPSPLGVNPMETIMGLVTRNAARLLDEGLGRGA